MAKIDSFKGEYRWLSNFYPCVLPPMDGIIPPTVEHAYQALKFISPDNRRSILKSVSPGKAKRLGKIYVDIRSDWEHMKVLFMQTLIAMKFSRENPDLCSLLIDTKNEDIIEGNTWGDTFWGVCNGQGKNILGNLLMERRSTLQQIP
jgi:N-glycosidase YbiA